MKGKVWVVSPVFYLMAAAMLVMSLLSFRQDTTLFIIYCTLTLLSFASLFVSDALLRKKIYITLKTARRVLIAQDDETLERFPLGIAVVASQGDVVWGNRRFREDVAQGKRFVGESVLRFIYPKTLRQVLSSEGASISHRSKEYTVYGIKAEECHILYFVEDTEYKRIAKEHRDKHPVVCVAVFDNREEIARGGAGGEESRINAEVDMVFRDWGNNKMGGFTRKLDNGRYLVVTDETHIEEAKKKRFAILDDVRKIRGETKISATASIGVGRGAADIAESERWARQALDMALGRGGDQVAVKQKDGAFEFFGGLSKGVEKRDKVRTRVIAAAISDRAKSSDKVFVMGHKNSDLDCVGAAVGMWAAIHKGLKKEAHIVVNRSQTLAGQLIERVEESYPLNRVFFSPQEALNAFTKESTLIIVDTHNINFVESRELLEAAQSIVVIDHHRMMVSHIQNAQIFYHEPYASSASEMVAELVQYIRSAAIEAVDAQAMLAGIMLDTKNFILKTGVRTFEASAFLRRCGADTVEVKRLFADSLDTYKEKAQLVSNAEIYKGCAIAVSSASNGNIRLIAAQAADELLSIQGVIASFVIFYNNGSVNMSARSLGDVNVQLIVEEFGGGGHLTMAGAQIKDKSVSGVRDDLIKTLDAKLSEVVIAQDS